MIALFKALFPAALLTWLVAMFIGSGGSSGGFLYVHMLVIEGTRIFWSWPLFTAGTALGWFVFSTMD